MLDDQQELFIVVDNNDTVLQYRSRFDCHHDRTLIHRAVGVVISNDRGKILLQKRSMKKDLNPGKFTISAGGHVTKGQTYEAAAQRELKEEIGVHIPITFVKKFLTRNEQESEMAVIFTAIYNGPFFPATDEVDMVQFFSAEEIIAMQNALTPIGRETLKHIGIL